MHKRHKTLFIHFVSLVPLVVSCGFSCFFVAINEAL